MLKTTAGLDPIDTTPDPHLSSTVPVNPSPSTEGYSSELARLEDQIAQREKIMMPTLRAHVKRSQCRVTDLEQFLADARKTTVELQVHLRGQEAAQEASVQRVQELHRLLGKTN